MTDIRTRFAPSPTGYLHIGGVRTALFNWLFARHHGGQFILRIEDTDVERSTEKSVDAILQGMEWLGLDCDEGPFYQSQRRDLYLSHIEKLMEEGNAYMCYCTQDELEKKRDKALAGGGKPKYDGTCRNLKIQPGEKSFTIRFKGPETGTTVVNDMIKGNVVFDNAELDDLVIARSDGSPTYNFVVVVDDANMGITHIIRGDDHLNNTPRQILLYEALGYTPPRFGHVPLILGQDRKRLSKRHGAASVMAYKEMGYLPQALVNYLARLGWSHGDQEIFSIEELIEFFNIDHIGRSAGIFNPDKLLWLNAHYIKEVPDENLTNLLIPFLEKRECDILSGPPVRSILPALRERANTLEEMAAMAEFYYTAEVVMDEKAAEKFLTDETIGILKEIIPDMEHIEPFTKEALEGLFRRFTDQRGLKLGKIAQPVRVALTGSTASPGIFEVIALLGRDKTLRRLKRAFEQA